MIEEAIELLYNRIIVLEFDVAGLRVQLAQRRGQTPRQRDLDLAAALDGGG